LSTFTIAIAFSSKKQACGPEAKALRAKSIGGKRKPLEGPRVFPQNAAGASGAPPVAPHRNRLVRGGKTSLPVLTKK